MDKNGKNIQDNDSSFTSIQSHDNDKNGSSDDENTSLPLSDEGIDTQFTPPFNYDHLKDTTDAEVYKIFRKTWDWNQKIQTEVRANHDEIKTELANTNQLITTVENVAKSANNKVDQIAVRSENTMRTTTAWYEELTQKLNSTHISINETKNKIFENKSEIKNISEEITQMKNDTRMRDEGCTKVIEEINLIKDTIRRTPFSSPPSKPKPFIVDAGSVKNSGVCFDDDQLFFPHEFLEEFDGYFEETNITERHKILAFKGVISTSDKSSFLENVRGVEKYQEIKDRFLEYYWDRRAQNEAMKYCRYKFIYTNDEKDMVNQMTRWARTLRQRQYANDSEIIDILIGKTPREYHQQLKEDGQSLERFLRKLNQLTKLQRDPDNEVPIQFRRGNKRLYDDSNNLTPSKPRYTSNQPPKEDQLQTLAKLFYQKAKSNTSQNYDCTQLQSENHQNVPKNSATYPSKDKSDKRDLDQTTPPHTKTPLNQNTTSYPKPFNIDNKGNLIMKRPNPRFPPQTQVAPVQTVQFDEEKNEYVVIQTPQEDLHEQVAICNMLNTMFPFPD
ncbi:unnamed protein product, partial [Allacma fusca]